ncbi:alpha/beta hydrolase [Terracidiphilus gabretensis]|uniref:alpha/beta hydrolase n=1 Tax=Terracidiphilus gabretensis TaxID=1577687 RepID=UPI00071B97D3|nr:dienelactone hydrolase family protein [Terracidiphilus gabretensis]
MTGDDPHGNEPILIAGVALSQARSALILLRGRGGSAEDILSLSEELGNESTAYLAPQAAQHTWYPNSFLASIAMNEPWLSSAIAKVGACIAKITSAGIGVQRIGIVGFSQGACLASEFVARHPARYAALVAFTGGLIGPMGSELHHAGNLDRMPILLSSGDPDPHVPWERVQATQEVFVEMGASVKADRYQGRPHTILREEIESARRLIEDGLS